MWMKLFLDCVFANILIVFVSFNWVNYYLCFIGCGYFIVCRLFVCISAKVLDHYWDWRRKEFCQPLLYSVSVVCCTSSPPLLFCVGSIQVLSAHTACALFWLVAMAVVMSDHSAVFEFVPQDVAPQRQRCYGIPLILPYLVKSILLKYHVAYCLIYPKSVCPEIYPLFLL